VTGTPGQTRRNALERLYADLEGVHRDYLEMFESVLDRLPDPRERKTPGYAKRIRATATRLRRLRLAYEPVRVKVRAVAWALHGVELAEPELRFVTAVLNYFPTGQVRIWGADSSGTGLLNYLYRHLTDPGRLGPYRHFTDPGRLGPALPDVVRDTLDEHRRKWVAVCQAYAAMQASAG
jgi:hypothetical protein